jgi:hypothetical protein
MEDGEPAERLMRAIRTQFSGEILEYAPLVAMDDSPSDKDSPVSS